MVKGFFVGYRFYPPGDDRPCRKADIEIASLSGAIPGVCDRVSAMKRFLLVLGIVLFLAGIAALIHPSFDYQKREEIARIGPIKATVDKQETEQVPVAATVALLVTGLVLVVLGSRTK